MFTTIFIALIFSLGVTDMPVSAAPADEVLTHTLVSEGELQLALRDLWNGHVFWVRSYVLASHYADEKGATAAEAKVVENARALADGITPFYGQAAADQLFELLAGHYGAIKAYMVSSYQEDEQGQAAAVKELTANAEQIADFLDSANPYLPKEVVLPLLMAHGGHHMQQINDIHGKDFDAEAEVWEAMLGHIYAISDAMAEALVKQFPEKAAGAE